MPFVSRVYRETRPQYISRQGQAHAHLPPAGDGGTAWRLPFVRGLLPPAVRMPRVAGRQGRPQPLRDLRDPPDQLPSLPAHAARARDPRRLRLRLRGPALFQPWHGPAACRGWPLTVWRCANRSTDRARRPNPTAAHPAQASITTIHACARQRSPAVEQALVTSATTAAAGASRCSPLCGIANDTSTCLRRKRYAGNDGAVLQFTPPFKDLSLW